VALDNVTGVGWGATRNSVNGVPTGTDYFIFWCDQYNVTRVQLNRENVYSTFIDKLWKAVGVRLLTEMLGGLREGKRYRFGDAILDDFGMELTKSHIFSADEKIKATWAELQIWSANGSLCIGKTNDKKAVLTLQYQGAKGRTKTIRSGSSGNACTMGRRGGLVGHRGDPWPSSCCDSGEVFRLRRHAFPESRLLSGPIRAWNTCGSGVGSPILPSSACWSSRSSSPS
jgi:hypothetical protein